MPELTALTHQQKITLGEMRSSGVRGLLVYCADYRCAHAVRISADRWPDETRLSDLERLFVCQACGRRGADIRPDWDWDIATARQWLIAAGSACSTIRYRCRGGAASSRSR